MAVCTFFGHRDSSPRIEQSIREVIVRLIENDGVNMFYIGNQGNFDYMVKKVLREFKQIYHNINYAVVLAYVPKSKQEFSCADYSDTIYPDGLESVPPKFAIDKRNRWMINESDFVVTYVKYIVGGAAKYKEIAERKGKTVINIAEN